MTLYDFLYDLSKSMTKYDFVWPVWPCTNPAASKWGTCFTACQNLFASDKSFSENERPLTPFCSNLMNFYKKCFFPIWYTTALSTI